MIFQYTLSKVLEGRKTQTRRLVRDNEAAIPHLQDITAVTHNDRTKWKVGHTYAVQPNRTAKQMARIHLTGIRQESVADISHEDAVAEGYENRAAFFAAWHEIHGPDYDEALVWVLEFELLD